MIRRAWAYLKHWLSAWNTTGEGVHSPALFYLIRMLIYDENRYYCWSDIEQVRRQLLKSREWIDVQDFGTGRSGRRQIGPIARNSLESRRCGEILFRLVTYLGEQLDRPLTIWELGTNLGVTTSYLAMAHSHNRVVTFEGSPELVKRAQANWRSLGISNITCVEGNIDDTLYIYSKEQGAGNQELGARNQEQGTRTLDLVYMDANHTYEATMRYWQALLPLAHEKTIFALDDIHHSPEMEQAWAEIKADPAVTSTMDFFDFALVFVAPYFWKRHYRLRL